MPELIDALGSLGVSEGQGSITIAAGLETGLVLRAGNSEMEGAYSPAVEIYGGDIDASTTGKGGDIYVRPGIGRGTGERGGNLYLDGGEALGGLATTGYIILGYQNAPSLPTSDPGVEGALWCDTAAGRVLKVSAG